jgi:hypothetical protein
MENTFEPYASIDVYNKALAKTILEHNVYITTRMKTAPALPDTVQMLVTSTGLIQPAFVTWDPIDPTLYDNPCSFTLNGFTEYGNVTARVNVLFHFTGEFPPNFHPPIEK